MATPMALPIAPAMARVMANRWQTDGVVRPRPRPRPRPSNYYLQDFSSAVTFSCAHLSNICSHQIQIVTYVTRAAATFGLGSTIEEVN